MRHYFDHASTSPLRPQAREAIWQVLELGSGDPGRIYTEALETRAIVEQAREQVANFLVAKPRSVIFTSGATEAIATVIRGASQVATLSGNTDRRQHQVASKVEHSAVLKNLELGEAGGFASATLTDATPTGLIDTAALAEAITPETSVVHLQLVNHEVGTIQDVKRAAELCHEQGVWLHTDAAQAVGQMPVNFEDLGADFMSVSAHKFGGPTGVGALLVRQGIRLEPLLAGGDQERARRAGLENVPAIAGFAAACQALSDGELKTQVARCQKMTEQITETLSSLDGIELIGHPRAPHIVCFHIQDIEPQAMVAELDRRGLAVHSGSACSSESLEPSPVLEAMGYDGQRSLRISVGWNTDWQNVDALLVAVPEVLQQLRSLRPA